MQKVVLFIKELDGVAGTQRVTVDLAMALSQRYDVSVIRMYGGVNENNQLPENVKSFVIFNEGFIRLRNRIFSYLYKLWKILKREKFNCALVVGRNNSFLMLFICYILRLPTVYCEHSTLFPIGRKITYKEKIIRNIANLVVFNLADRIVLLTKRERDIFFEKGLLNNKVLVIPNFIKNSSKSSLFQQNSSFVSVFNNHLYKGFDLLILIAQRLKAECPNFEWDVYGGNFGLKEQEEIVRAGLVNNVFLKGSIKNFDCIEKKYLCFCCTSRSEGFSLVILEAKLAGLPVISFDINSGPSDLIEHGVNGYLCPPFNYENFAIKMKQLLEHKQVASMFSIKSASGLDSFDKNLIIYKWVKLINNLIGIEKNE